MGIKNDKTQFSLFTLLFDDDALKEDSKEYDFTNYQEIFVQTHQSAYLHLWMAFLLN